MGQRNASNADDIKRAEIAEETADADLRWVLSDPRGRRFIWRELGRCGLHAQTYSPNNSDQSFRAGERNAAIRLNLDVIRVSTEHYLLMQQEHFDQEKRNALNNERGHDHD